MKIIKFGGSVVKEKEDIINIIQFLKTNQISSNTTIIISAFDKFTSKLNDLIEIVINNSHLFDYEFKKILYFIDKYAVNNDNQVSENIIEELKNIINAVSILEECSDKTKDNILSLGDLISSKIFYNYIEKSLENVNFIDSRNVFITDSSFGKANIKFEDTISNLRKYNSEKINVLAGFIGADKNGNPTTLGYENSNLSALLCSIAFENSECEYITDTDGLFEVDPKLIDSNRIDYINYSDAIKLANGGLKVFTKEQLELAQKHKITLIYTSIDNYNSKTIINDSKSTYQFVFIIKDSYFLVYYKDINKVMRKLSNIDNKNLKEININIKESYIKIHSDKYSDELLKNIYKELNNN